MDKNKLNIFAKIPTLKTERLILRKMLTSDADDMFEYARRPEVTKYLLWSPHESKKVTRGYLSYLQAQYSRKNFFDWAITIEPTGKMIGTVGFSAIDTENDSAEIGYVLSPDYWGMGVAAEAVRRVIDFGFEELNLHRIEAKIILGNTQSERVAEKCGLSKEAEMKDKMLIKGEYKTILLYALVRDGNAK